MKDLNQLFKKAEDFKRKGLLDNAIELYNEILAEDPDYEDIHAILGEIYYIKGDVELSVQNYELQIAKCSENCLVLYRLGITYYRATQFSKSIHILSNLLQKGCELDMAYYWMGLAYYHTGRIHKSIEMFETLRDKMPQNTIGCNNLALAYKTIGDYTKAIECFKQILAEDPAIVSVHYNMGLSYLGDMQIALALKHFQRVVELDPEHIAARKKLDEIYNDQEMLYSYGIAAPKDITNHEELDINFRIGEAYKGFSMIDKTFKYLKSLAIDKDKK
ncbi:MAG: tetratricopeptide repeat protein [Candidatus Cloacimonetes bacterium]|nr:tetratricopeptide repeat protein [Candidatus Cloacimonadota bacterium]